MRNVIFTVLFMLLFSCVEKLVEKPDNLVPKEKMVEILNDMAILNAAKSTDITILRNHGIEAMEYIYSKHEIDSVQFAESDFYYASLPQEYEAIYIEVEAKIKKEKERIEEVKKVNDSVNKMKPEAIKKKIKDSLR
ncbi:hypothetical protein MNBD_BACTEROID03-2405 [hydrothermal vent metagenome]|uniref:DUF4296 domain-containing protein n=1 Tax=hydrothermal vent metagenome TaxID=652676 RepID=A0A3B0TVZ1_9ZZZZ